MTAPFVLRPVPDDRYREKMAEGKKRVGFMISASWFEQGRLEVDDGGFWLTDADGERHQIPVPPSGRLVYLDHWENYYGKRADFYYLLIVDHNDHLVAELPAWGFDRAGLERLASAAGLPFAVVKLDSHKTGNWYQRFPKSDATVNLQHAMRAKGDRRGLGKLFGATVADAVPAPLCPSCHHQPAVPARYCPRCGTWIRDGPAGSDVLAPTGADACPACGHGGMAGDHFCPSCGSRLDPAPIDRRERKARRRVGRESARQAAWKVKTPDQRDHVLLHREYIGLVGCAVCFVAALLCVVVLSVPGSDKLYLVAIEVGLAAKIPHSLKRVQKYHSRIAGRSGTPPAPSPAPGVSP